LLFNIPDVPGWPAIVRYPTLTFLKVCHFVSPLPHRVALVRLEFFAEFIPMQPDVVVEKLLLRDLPAWAFKRLEYRFEMFAKLVIHKRNRCIEVD
jgi:hypothetical protein